MLNDRSRLIALMAALVLPLWAPAAQAQDFWALLKKPGAIILLRHSNAPAEPPDADLENLKNCKTQRNLDEAGREQARRIGDEFRKRGIKQARIYSSQYCRALETARLTKLGPVTELAALNQAFYTQPVVLREGTAKVTQFMKTLRGKGLAVLVSHVSNIQSIAGVQLDSGEMAVAQLDTSGEVAVGGRLLVK